MNGYYQLLQAPGEFKDDLQEGKVYRLKTFRSKVSQLSQRFVSIVPADGDREQLVLSASHTAGMFKAVETPGHIKRKQPAASNKTTSIATTASEKNLVSRTASDQPLARPAGNSENTWLAALQQQKEKLHKAYRQSLTVMAQALTKSSHQLNKSTIKQLSRLNLDLSKNKHADTPPSILSDAMKQAVLKTDPKNALSIAAASIHKTAEQSAAVLLFPSESSNNISRQKNIPTIETVIQSDDDTKLFSDESDGGIIAEVGCQGSNNQGSNDGETKKTDGDQITKRPPADSNYRQQLIDAIRESSGLECKPQKTLTTGAGEENSAMKSIGEESPADGIKTGNDKTTTTNSTRKSKQHKNNGTLPGDDSSIQKEVTPLSNSTTIRLELPTTIAALEEGDYQVINNGQSLEIKARDISYICGLDGRPKETALDKQRFELRNRSLEKAEAFDLLIQKLAGVELETELKSFIEDLQKLTADSKD